MTYSFPSANNGRVASTTDNLSGETVTFSYDQLNRLVQAMTNDAWGLGFTYDGFGNLLQETSLKGGTPSMSVSVNPQTNQISTAGYAYDANGNLTQAPGATYSYDVAGRMVSNGAVYSPSGQRVYDGTYLYYYGARGELYGKYTANWSGTPTAFLADPTINLSFAGVPLQMVGHGSWVAADRLGSARVNARGERLNYFPYGGEVGTESAEGRTKFATYFRDSAGVDYANQRYYNQAGRFFTPDPDHLTRSVSSDLTDPRGWNRYTYVEGDPANYFARNSLDILAVDESFDDEDTIGEADDFSGPHSAGLRAVTPTPQTTPGGTFPSEVAGEGSGVTLDSARVQVPSADARTGTLMPRTDPPPGDAAATPGITNSGPAMSGTGLPISVIAEYSSVAAGSLRGDFNPESASRHCDSLGSVKSNCAAPSCKGIGAVFGTLGTLVGIWYPGAGNVGKGVGSSMVLLCLVFGIN